MAIIHGVVRDGVVILPESAQLPEGSQVEVRPIAESENENEFYRCLLESGLVTKLPAAHAKDLRRSYDPIHVSGQPLSEQIIDERR